MRFYTLSPSVSGVVRVFVRDEPAAVVLRGARNSLLSHSDYYQHSELSGDILSTEPSSECRNSRTVSAEKKECDFTQFKSKHAACLVWRRFSNLFETIQSLFWAVFGLVSLADFELAGGD